MPDIRGALNLPFAEQIAFFEKKLSKGSQSWNLLADGTPIEGAMHDTAFIVAGVTKADLLADLRAAVEKAIKKGTGLTEFRRDFKQIVTDHGWHGWTGEGTKAGEAWRTRVIWETNLATSYAAGRHAQLTDPELLARRPYWKYVHNESVLNPRPQHLAWDGLVLHHDDDFWKSHYPPNGWGCQCRVAAVKGPGEGDKTEPPAGWNKPDEKGRLPGVDRGWNYAPGASVAEDLRRIVEEKAAKLPPDLGGMFAQAVDDAGIPRRQLAEDWQGQRPGLFDLPPVQVVEMPEMPGLTHEERMARATEAFKALRESGLPLYNDDSGWVFGLNRKSQKKIADNLEQTEASLQASMALRELVKNAVVAERHPDARHENEFVTAIYRAYASAAIEGQVFRVKLTAQQFAQGNDVRKILHALEAMEIENAPLGTLPNSSGKKVGTAQPTTGRTITIADLLKSAIRNDGTPFEYPARKGNAR
ncbi:MAG: hypothetical protein LBJ59_08175 [Zoogloeaceae bacterium]|jgi:hypothetical protein|nr:hypothetical protein [Zoogloeaceae bacterium]